MSQSAIGSHRVVCGEDVFFIECAGDLTAEQMPVFLDIVARYSRQHGYLLVLIDAARVGTMDPAARRLSVAYRKQSTTLSATAIFGASLLSRTLSTLLFNAMALITDKVSEVAFFKGEAEARVWLDEQRRALIKRKR